MLFSGKLQETLERAAEDAQWGLELGAVRVALVRGVQEIEGPGGAQHDGEPVGACAGADGAGECGSS